MDLANANAAELIAEIERLRALNAKLLAACEQAHHLVADEDNNPIIVTMAGSFGLLADLESAIAAAKEPTP